MREEDDSALFLASMEGVTPLKSQQEFTMRPAQDERQHQQRNHQAHRRLALELLPTELGQITPVAPDAVISVKSSGVQSQVFKLFRQGKYEIQADIDLKGMPLMRARELLYDFVQRSRTSGLRNIIVIHGTGVNNQPFPAKMKSCVVAWLAAIDGVIGYHSAPKEWGGAGAMMVMLEKSLQARIDTAERHHKGPHRR